MDKILPEGKKGGYRQYIREQAASLADILAQTPEYQQYREARDKLIEHREHALLLQQLRQHQAQLQAVPFPGEESYGEKVIEDIFSLDPVISEYLYAEGRFNRFLTDIQEVFGDRLELWEYDWSETDTLCLN